MQHAAGVGRRVKSARPAAPDEDGPVGTPAVSAARMYSSMPASCHHGSQLSVVASEPMGDELVGIRK